MFTKFDEHDMLELFESEPSIIPPEEAGMYIYSKLNQNGVKLLLDLSVYEHKCHILLCIGEDAFFETELKNVEYLRREGNCLRIHRFDSESDYLLYFFPNFFMKIENFGETEFR